MAKFYKNEYLIAIYDQEDSLVDVCDNAKEFGIKYNRDYDVACSIISRINKGSRKSFIHEGRNLVTVLIPLDPEEIIELQKKEESIHGRQDM